LNQLIFHYKTQKTNHIVTQNTASIIAEIENIICIYTYFSCNNYQIEY